MILLRQLARNVPECVTDLEAGGQPLGLPWRERLAGRPHRMRAQVVPDQDDPPASGNRSSDTHRSVSASPPVLAFPSPLRALRASTPSNPPRLASPWVATQECTQIGKNGLSGPFRGTCVHCCTVADNRGYAGVYTDRQKWPLDAGLGRSCTLLRRNSPRQRPTQTPEEP